MSNKEFPSNRVSRAVLSGSAAAVALMMAAGQAQAQANDACGPLVDGAVDCTIAGGPYPRGVQYGDGGPEDIRVRLEDGLSITPEDRYAGVYLLSNGGSLAIEGSGADIATHNASGAVAYTYGYGDIVIDLATVSTELDEDQLIRGVQTYTDAGTTSIRVGELSTRGDYVVGVVAESLIGDIDITAGSIETNGFASDGIAVSTGGNINVNVDEIRGDGDYIWGVNASNGAYANGYIYGGVTSVNVGSIDLTGDYNAGVVMQTYSSAFVNVGDIDIDGDFGVGVSVAFGAYDADSVAVVDVGNVTLAGEGNLGVVVQGYGAALVSVDSVVNQNGGGVAVQGVFGAAVLDAGSVEVAGDFGRAIQVASNYSDATLRVDSAQTDGFLAHAVSVQGYQGVVRVDAGRVVTLGEYSNGLVVTGQTSTTLVRDALSTEGAYSVGLLNSTTRGDAIVDIAGDVTTLGHGSDGMWVTGRYGTARIRTAGEVSTEGSQAFGIKATGEDGQVDIVAASVKTAGEGSNGIHARTRYAEFFLGQGTPNYVPFEGDITIQAAQVEVTGAGAMGISARGIGTADITAGDVSAFDNFAIDADMIGDVAIDARGHVVSQFGSAISAQGADVQVSVGPGGQVSGGLDGIVVSALGARCVQRPPTDGVSENPCPNPGADEFYGPVEGIPVGFGGEATVVNDGVISADAGYAVRVANGRLSLLNNGRIEGAVLSLGGDDLFENAGVFEVTKDSDFGAGVDLLRNTGVVRFAEADAPAAVTLRNLDQFENAGLIDLRNSAVGDVLTLPGDFSGTGASTLALDVDMAAGEADRLVIGGAATGSTLLTLNGDASTATLTPAEGIVIVETGAGSSEDAFSLAPGAGDKGFVGYRLSFDSASGQYALNSAASAAAHRQIGLLQGAESGAGFSADLWRSNNAAARDTFFSGGESGRVWAAIQGGETSRDWSSDMADGQQAALDYQETRLGGQMGYDAWVQRTALGETRVGVTAGYGQGEFDYRDSADAFDLSSLNLGVYAHAVRGAYFASLLAKYDRVDAEIETSAIEGEADLELSTWDLDGQIGYRFGDAARFVEPMAGLRWTSTSADDLIHGAQTLAFETADDVSIRLGVRVGGGRTFSSGDGFTFFASAQAVHSLGDDYSLRLISGESERLEAGRVETYGQAVFGVSYRTASGLETFAEGQGEAGSGYDGVFGRVGVRLRF